MTDGYEGQQSSSGKEGVQLAVERFNELPSAGKYALIGVGLFFVFVILFRGGGGAEPTRPAVKQEVSRASIQNLENKSPESGSQFTTVDAERDSLYRGFVSQQQIALSGLRDDVKTQMDQRDSQFLEIQNRVIEQTSKLDEMIRTFEVQIRSMQEDNVEFREQMSRLAEEAQRQGVRQGMGMGGTPERRRQRVSQTPLGSGGMAGGGINGQPLIPGIIGGATGGNVRIDQHGNVIGPVVQEVIYEDPNPFLPPLGFIKGTLLNGVDALAGAGVAAPALVRMSGTYKTAMNSTVSLDGCMMLVEFEGELSTERALGKPSQMTCVYPDRGAVTYGVTGYVVDAKDGIVGVPGVFYEGDPSKIAAVFAAEFLAGVASLVEESQITRTSDLEGNEQTTVTGSQVQAQLSSGVNDSVQTLRDYLVERLDRVQSFIRLDATRDIHIVMLSGIELRGAGSPWTLLFEGVALDAARAKAENAAAQANESQAAAQSQNVNY
jgi:hypothetical protein